MKEFVIHRNRQSASLVIRFGAIRLMAAVFFMLFMICLCGSRAVYADGAAYESRFPTLRENLVLTRGDRVLLDLPEKGAGVEVTLASSKPKVVSVSARGKITAKRCGIAIITAFIRSKETVSRLNVRVEVRYSSFYHAKNYGKGRVLKGSGRICFHREMTAGEKSKIRLTGIDKNARVSFNSGNKSAAAVDRDGNVRAIKEGSAVINIKVSQNGETFMFREKIHVISAGSRPCVSDSDVNAYFSKSAFIGNSIGLGQKMYFDSMGDGFLGDPVMMVKGCYSFANDRSSSNQYKITYRGRAYRAKDAVSKSGVRRVFINMGTNDLGQGAARAYQNYASYLAGIRSENPDVVIFIESTTPAYGSAGKGHLNNSSIRRLNALMKKYCENHRDCYYIDVHSVLKGPGGGMKAAYSSDRYVHVTMAGYRAWTGEVVRYVRELLTLEREAKDAVMTAVESGELSDYRTAVKKAGRLKESSVRAELEKRLKKCKKKIRRAA